MSHLPMDSTLNGVILICKRLLANRCIMCNCDFIRRWLRSGNSMWLMNMSTLRRRRLRGTHCKIRK